MEVASTLTITGTLNNLGTVKVLGQYGFYQTCLATFANHGLLQLAATAGSNTVTTFPAEDWNCGLNNRAKLLNASDGTIESLATARVTFDGLAILDNDGVLVNRAGRLSWRSYSTVVPPSTGRFAGEGGIIELSSVAVSPETQFGNGLEVNGYLTGSGSLPAGVTLTLVTSETLTAQLSGPGWVSAKGGTLAGDVVGNVRVEPTVDRTAVALTARVPEHPQEEAGVAREGLVRLYASDRGPGVLAADGVERDDHPHPGRGTGASTWRSSSHAQMSRPWDRLTARNLESKGVR